MDINEATAKAIQAERAAAGLTIKDLSERSGVPISTLMRILKSERDIKVNQIAQLADVLDLYPHEILQEAEKYIEREERAPINLNTTDAEHPERFTLVAKRGDIEAEQDMYNELP